MLKIKVHYLVDSTKTVYRRQFTRNLYQCSMLEDQDLMQFFKEWNPYQMPVGVLEDQRKIGQLSLLRKLHNTQHGYAYFEGEILYNEHQDTTYLDHRSRGNLFTQRR
ncbi:hypothetical protein HanRHA438_Chr16g0741451 [Helianthus annuus]|nr:hypothetical protein HanRHA438_Chr16g0741451 [Helianthus annuus]